MNEKYKKIMERSSWWLDPGSDIQLFAYDGGFKACYEAMINDMKILECKLGAVEERLRYIVDRPEDSISLMVTKDEARQALAEINSPTEVDAGSDTTGGCKEE